MDIEDILNKTFQKMVISEGCRRKEEINDIELVRLHNKLRGCRCPKCTEMADHLQKEFKKYRGELLINPNEN